MHHTTDKIMSAGYGIDSLFIASARIKQWERYFALPPDAAQAPAASIRPDDIKADEFILKKVEMLLIELLSYSHRDLVDLAEPVMEAMQVHMTTPRITTLIYRAIRGAGDANGMISGQHRAMILTGQFSSNVLAHAYAVTLRAIEQGAKYHPRSVFAQAVKSYGKIQARRQQSAAAIPEKTPAATAVEQPVAKKKSPAKKTEDVGFYDR